MRDPSFYRLHEFVDDIFEEYKNTLPPYTSPQVNHPEQPQMRFKHPRFSAKLPRNCCNKPRRERSKRKNQSVSNFLARIAGEPISRLGFCSSRTSLRPVHPLATSSIPIQHLRRQQLKPPKKRNLQNLLGS